MKTPSFLIRPITASLFWGFIGGLSLIGITFLTNKGFIQILPYPIILINAILFLKFNDTSDKAFTRMLFTGLAIFVFMSLVLSFYVQIFVNATFNITLAGELWRLGAIVAIGFVSSLLLSIIAKPVRQKGIATI
jgi:fucose permease